MRVTFLSPWDTGNPGAWSGVVPRMHEALAARADLEVLHTAPAGTALTDRIAARLVGAVSSRSYLPGHALATGRRHARYVQHRLRAQRTDIILAVAASQDVAYLHDHRPIVQVTDATIPAILDFYPTYTGLHPLSTAQAKSLERRGNAATAAFALASGWAAGSLVNECGVPPERCHVAPFGPGIEPRGDMTRRDHQGPLRVLAITSDWQRKGGPQALEAVARVRAAGTDASLTLVGEAPGRLPDWVSFLGRVPRDRMPEIYSAHDVLLELAHANAAGVSLTDAHAFGIPSVATLTGGTATIVDDGHTGMLLDAGPGLPARAASSLIRLSDPATRHKFADLAIDRFRTLLNWDTWADRILEVCANVLERPRTAGEGS